MTPRRRPRVSAVTVTKPDGSVDIRPAYDGKTMRRIRWGTGIHARPAPFEGTCQACGKRWPLGTPIRPVVGGRHHSKGWRHDVCPGGPAP